MYTKEQEEFLEVFQNIKKHLDYIEEQKIKKVQDLEKSQDKYLAVSMSVFCVLNNLIELGEKYIEFSKFPYPTKYREIAKILKDKKVITYEEFKIFDKLILNRNNIAHEYDVSITPQDLVWCIENLAFIKKFMSNIKNKIF